MIARYVAHRIRGRWFLYAAAACALVGVLVTPGQAVERKFTVMLAYSPKENMNPQLVNYSIINDQYFNNNPNDAVFSFAEYWREVSYGDVTVAGQTFGWVPVPWRYHPMTSSPADYTNINTLDKNGMLLPPYAYGAAEDVIANQSMITTDWNGPDVQGFGAPSATHVCAVAVVDNSPDCTGGAPVNSSTADESYVYTPGERFVDLNGNGRYDALNEIIGVDLNLGADAEPPIVRPAFVSPPPGNPPPVVPADVTAFAWNSTDYNNDGMLMNEMDCVVPIAKVTFAVAPMQSTWVTGPATGMCEWVTPGPPANDDPAIPNCNTFLQLCEGVAGMMPATSLPPCCEFNDKDGDDAIDIAEPYEDFMRLYNPDGQTFPAQWPIVSDTYIENNYPGNKNRLKTRSMTNPNGRTGNNFYNSPDRWIERGNTKMIQQPYPNQYSVATTAPGMYPCVPVSVQGTPWYNTFWQVWYGDASPPAWGGAGGAGIMLDPQSACPATLPPSGMPSANTPNMVAFTPYTDADMDSWHYFAPNKGGLTGTGFGNTSMLPDSATISYSNWDPVAEAKVNPGGNIQPDLLGFYDGWVEHDDLPSSKYHTIGTAQDQRLGEVTSPYNSSISGQDRGNNNPNQAQIQPDGFITAGGPFAINVHGSGGFDAGNNLLLEYMTWRRDGTKPTGAAPGAPNSIWELTYGFYHPYQGKGTMMSPAINIGFRDYNLDGIVDQGEVRPAGSENYIVDADQGTIDNGAFTKYPWRRNRLVEDVIAALDYSVDFDPFVDPLPTACDGAFGGSLQFALNPPPMSGIPAASGALSGVILLPAGSVQGLEFTVPAPSLFPIHNQDQPNNIICTNPSNPSTCQYNWHMWVHDLVADLDTAGEGPAPLGAGTYETAYAAHEYMHAWECLPDLYDYDVYDSVAQPINHPVGRWCIMAGGGLVHPVAPLKEDRSWIDPVNLEKVLVPGVPKTLTLPPAEFFRYQSYLFFENPKLLTTMGRHERFYLWSVGKGFDQFMPGPGLLILHTDRNANVEGLPPQQLMETHFSYNLVQADGLHQLEAAGPENGFGDGNDGDAADPYPGAVLYPGPMPPVGQNPNHEFSRSSTPRSEWWDQTPTGFKIDNIQHDDMVGTSTLRFTWTPPDVPSLTFINPPGGQSVFGQCPPDSGPIGNCYRINYEATDQFGGTTMKFYWSTMAGDHTVQPGNANFIGQTTKLPGTVEGSVYWNLTNVANSNYYIFAKLIPGPGIDGTDLPVSPLRPGLGNVGNGTVIVTIPMGIAANPVTKSESWTITAGTNNMWTVSGSVSGAQTGMATTGVPYSSDKINSLGQPDPNGFSAISLTITNGSVPFVPGDEFVFVTTGLTQHSQPVQVANGVITNGPTAVINATPAAGNAPLTVHFSSLGSTDPSGLPLMFSWVFGDGTTGVGPMIDHIYALPGSYIATLTATNTAGQFGQASIQILSINDLPVAHITAAPLNGALPLTVNLSGATSSDPEGQPLIYQWNFGDCPAPGCLAGNGMPGPPFVQLSHTYTTAGLYTVTLTVTDPSGGMGQDTIQIVAGNSAPVVSVAVENSTGAAPLTVTFHDTGSFDPDNPSAGATGLTFSWNFGDGAPPEPGTSVMHTYTSPGPYNASVTVTDSPSNPALALSITVNLQQIFVTSGVMPPPTPGGLVAAFTTDRASGAAPLAVNFDASASSGPPGATLQYNWDFGDGATGTGVMTSHTYQTAGTYMARLTLTAGSASASVTHTITATGSGAPPGTEIPVARVTANPLMGAVPLTVSFDAGNSTPADGSLTFSWDFGDGVSATGVQAQHTYNATGTYMATLRAVNNAGSSMASVSITVSGLTGNRAPLARIATAPTTGIAPTRLTFDGTLSNDPDGDLLTYLWEVRLGDQVVQSIDTGARVSIPFDQPGEYALTLTVTDSNGASARTEPLAVSIRARVGSDSGTTSPSNSNGRRAAGRSGGLCGVGLISVLGTALGLMALANRTRRRS